jgi:kelch-like protein 2/3
MKTPRSWFAAAVIGTQVYIAGGQGKTHFLDSAEVYDSEKDTWHSIASMGSVRSSCHGVALDGEFWVIAGEYNKNHYDDGNRKGSAEVFDPLTGSWRFIPDMWLDSHKVHTHILLLLQAVGRCQTEYHKIKKAYNLLCFTITDCN